MNNALVRVFITGRDTMTMATLEWRAFHWSWLTVQRFIILLVRSMVPFRTGMAAGRAPYLTVGAWGITVHHLVAQEAKSRTTNGVRFSLQRPALSGKSASKRLCPKSTTAHSPPTQTAPPRGAKVKICTRGGGGYFTLKI